MAIPDNIIDKIQERVDIVEVISQYIPLKKTGRNYKANCPFHHEKTPSFVVSPDKQIYHCFGCGAGGNVFSFLMKQEGVEFPEAVETLAERAGVVLPRNSIQTKEASALADKLYRINESAAEYFQACLKNNSVASDYVRTRGIGTETASKFKIGYAPDSWDGLLNFSNKKGVDAAFLEKAGLVIANDRGGHYDRFRKRIIFPIVDLKNKVLGFGGRVLDASLPKYVNSPETQVYSKGRSLYGLNLSRDHIKKEGYALIVEGYLDFIIPYQAGITNIIATLGTAFTLDQIKLLKRFAKTAVMVYDPDEAGEAASLRNLDIFISEDVNVYIAELPKGYDPDTYIRKFGADEFRKLIKSSKNLFDYKLDKLSKKYDMRSANGKASIAGEMLPTLSRISNEVLKSNLVKKLSEKLSVDEEALKIEMKKVKTDYGPRKYMTALAEVKKDFKTAEKMVLALLLDGSDYIKKAKEKLTIEEFRDTSIRDLVKAIFDLHQSNKEINPAKLISHLENKETASALISEAVSLSEIMVDKDKVLEDCALRMKKDNVADQLERLRTEIKTAQDSKDEDSLKKLLAEFNNLVRSSKA